MVKSRKNINMKKKNKKKKYEKIGNKDSSVMCNVRICN